MEAVFDAAAEDERGAPPLFSQAGDPQREGGDTAAPGKDGDEPDVAAGASMAAALARPAGVLVELDMSGGKGSGGGGGDVQRRVPARFRGRTAAGPRRPRMGALRSRMPSPQATPETTAAAAAPAATPAATGAATATATATAVADGGAASSSASTMPASSDDLFAEFADAEVDASLAADGEASQTQSPFGAGRTLGEVEMFVNEALAAAGFAAVPFTSDASAEAGSGAADLRPPAQRLVGDGQSAIARCLRCVYTLLQRVQADSRTLSAADDSQRLLRSEVDRLRSTTSELRDQCVKLDKDKAFLEGKLDSAAKQYKRLRKEMAEKVSELGKQMLQLQHRDAHYTTKLRKQEQEYDRLKTSLTRLVRQREPAIKRGLTACGDGTTGVIGAPGAGGLGPARRDDHTEFLGRIQRSYQDKLLALEAESAANKELFVRLQDSLTELQTEQAAVMRRHAALNAEQARLQYGDGGGAGGATGGSASEGMNELNASFDSDASGLSTGSAGGRPLPHSAFDAPNGLVREGVEGSFTSRMAALRAAIYDMEAADAEPEASGDGDGDDAHAGADSGGVGDGDDAEGESEAAAEAKAQQARADKATAALQRMRARFDEARAVIYEQDALLHAALVADVNDKGGDGGAGVDAGASAAARGDDDREARLSAAFESIEAEAAALGDLSVDEAIATREEAALVDAVLKQREAAVESRRMMLSRDTRRLEKTRRDIDAKWRALQTQSHAYAQAGKENAKTPAGGLRKPPLSASRLKAPPTTGGKSRSAMSSQRRLFGDADASVRATPLRAPDASTPLTLGSVGSYASTDSVLELPVAGATPGTRAALQKAFAGHGTKFAWRGDDDGGGDGVEISPVEARARGGESGHGADSGADSRGSGGDGVGGSSADTGGGGGGGARGPGARRRLLPL